MRYFLMFITYKMKIIPPLISLGEFGVLFLYISCGQPVGVYSNNNAN